MSDSHVTLAVAQHLLCMVYSLPCSEEKRRHARVLKKASHLAVSELLEIAAMKGVTASIDDAAGSGSAADKSPEALPSNASSASGASCAEHAADQAGDAFEHGDD